MKLNSGSVEYTKEMRKTHTILLPSMLPFIFPMLAAAFSSCGYKMEALENYNDKITGLGLEYANNEMCYPAIQIIGQMLDALNSGKYDISRVALLIPQAGGGCRASNYYYALRKALDTADFGSVPIVSLNISKIEHNSGFKITLPLIRKSIAAIYYGDILMYLYHDVHPYEINKGKSKELVYKWQSFLSGELMNNHGYSRKALKKNYIKIINDFKNVKIQNTPKIKVGIVGELYIKFCCLGNNNLDEFLDKEACAYKMGGFINYSIYVVDSYMKESKDYSGSKILGLFADKIKHYLEVMQKDLIEAIKENSNFSCPAPFEELKQKAENIISTDCLAGDGWLISAEIIDLIQSGYENIISVHPFGCMVSHVCARGVLNKIKKFYHDADIVDVEYDSSSSQLNVKNRIMLLIDSARKRMI